MIDPGNRIEVSGPAMQGGETAPEFLLRDSNSRAVAGKPSYVS
jgi:hypothetical protein